MHRYAGHLVVIHAGTAQLGLGQGKAQRFDKVQFGTRYWRTSRITLPVLGGISGATRTTWNTCR
jgi:hypothetical protein